MRTASFNDHMTGENRELKSRGPEHSQLLICDIRTEQSVFRSGLPRHYLANFKL